MKLLSWLTTGVVTFGLAACYPATETSEDDVPSAVVEVSSLIDEDLAPFTSLLEADFVEADAAEIDLTSVLEAMPASTGLDWDTMSFDGETGATVFTGLALSLGTENPMGIRFGEAHVWGLESDFLAARLNGERLSESGPLMTRFDGRSLSYFGIDTGINAAIGSVMDMIAAEGDIPESFEVAVDAFDYTAERMLMTDVALLPWEYTPLSADLLPEDLDEEPEAKDLLLAAVHFGQQFIAVSRSLGFDTMIMTDAEMNLEMRQPGSILTAETRIEFYGLSDAVGFDFGKTVARNVKNVQTTEYVEMGFEDDEFGDFSSMGMPVGLTIDQATSYSKAVSEDIKLDKVLGYLARSEMPGMDERDLLSLGRSTVTDFDVQLNDGGAFSAKEIELHADNFEWFIPSNLQMIVDDGVISIADLSVFTKNVVEAFAASARDEMSETEAEEMTMIMEGIDKGIALLPDYGLDTVTLDGAFTATWDADQGPAEFAYNTDSEGFGAEAFSLALNFPIYETLQAASVSEDIESALEAAFEEAFAIRSGRYFQQDKGGYDKILGFVNAIGAEYPEQGWGAMVSNMDPAQMRAYGATLVRMGRAGAEAEFPPAAAWLDAIATYVEAGGSIEFAMRPSEPVTPETFDELDQTDDPQAVVDRLGLSVTHTPN
ncbi:MAG: hypothetical protein AAF768_06705 [Pseudomonadota bacterium]